MKKLTSNPKEDGFFINRLLIFMGRPVRHGGLYPSWNLRLFRRGKARYEQRAVHEHMVCNGGIDYLHEEMIHIRRESISQYIEKHIAYADMESDEWVRWQRDEQRRRSERAVPPCPALPAVDPPRSLAAHARPPALAIPLHVHRALRLS